MRPAFVAWLLASAMSDARVGDPDREKFHRTSHAEGKLITRLTDEEQQAMLREALGLEPFP